MTSLPKTRRALPISLASLVVAIALLSPLHAQQISLQTLVTPSTTIIKDGHPLTFALHGFIQFNSLSELFPYIDSQTQRWKGGLDDAARKDLARDLLRRGIESRVVSMTDERPLETLLTHTTDELRAALSQVTEPVPPGYGDSFLAVQEKWKHSLNCWSAAPSIPARVLSNWYPIEEGIELHGSTYDSTEHFWQAIKYHPDTTVTDLTDLLSIFEHKDWGPWLSRLDEDPKLYLPNAYAVEFMRHNLGPERLRWFRDQLATHGLHPGDRARLAQQRRQQSGRSSVESPANPPFRFTAFEEKVLWGDLADLFQLVYLFSSSDDPVRKTLAEQHFDGIYLPGQNTGDPATAGRKLGFISQDFRLLMLDIWKVKYLQVPRFREVIRSIPLEIRLSHFLNDGDSPDIPIPTYVEYLNQIRNQARQ
jgi:hypothetical protein